MTIATVTVKQPNYQGQVSCTSLKRCGHGTYTYSDAFTYQGSWNENGQKHGNGNFRLLGYCTYTGDFSEGEITGHGEMRWDDGRCYVGEFFRGDFQGQGSWSDGRGVAYTGLFKRGRRHGQGTLTTPTLSYTGNFKFHKFDGFGELREGGSFYRGEFSAGKFDGAGKLFKETEKSKFEGFFRGGLKNGPGCLTFENLIFTKTGEWADDLPTCVAARVSVTTQDAPSWADLLADPKSKGMVTAVKLEDNPDHVRFLTAASGGLLPTILLSTVTEGGDAVSGESGRILDMRLVDRKNSAREIFKTGNNAQLCGNVIFSEFRRFVLFEGKSTVEGIQLPKIAKGLYWLEFTDISLNPLPPACLALSIN